MELPTKTPMLTSKEHRIIEILAELANDFSDIMGNHQGACEVDMREVGMHIHALQEKVMAQAASRAYPNLYRLLGEVIENEVDINE